MIWKRMQFSAANSQHRPEDFWLVILPVSISMEKVMGLSICSCMFSAAAERPLFITARMATSFFSWAWNSLEKDSSISYVMAFMGGCSFSRMDSTMIVHRRANCVNISKSPAATLRKGPKQV